MISGLKELLGLGDIPEPSDDEKRKRKDFKKSLDDMDALQRRIADINATWNELERKERV